MKKAFTPAAVFVALATIAWFVCSRLAFAPVPWPDGSAFYLPSLELFSWPPRWVMHNQAAFVPSYDEANFNIMPAFPAYLGLGAALGLRALLGSVLAIKLLSTIPVAIFAWVHWRWLSRERMATWIAAAVTLCALWDPTLRWDALAVRTEPIIGVFWALILWELSRPAPRPRRLGGLLAGAAWFHYEAVYLVPAVALALAGSWRDWSKRLLGVGAWTLVFLSPWILFAVFHFGLFWSQMDIAFHRLGHGNRYVANPYLLFHSLFFWLGSPVGTPKFFNLAKALFWALAISLTVRALVLARKPSGFVRLGASIAFWMGLYLWVSKPEVWYTAICHLTFWPWIALELALESREPQLRWRSLPWACASFAALSFLATLGQQLEIPPYYSWANYHGWVDCIEKSTELASESGAHRVRIWQPHYPDALVELSDRHRDYDLTRTLDFEARKPLALEFARGADILLFTRFYNLSRADEHATFGASGDAPAYSGPERPEDLRLLSENDVESPFGPWAAEELEISEPGARKRSVCQVGPFWAEIFRRESREGS